MKEIQDTYEFLTNTNLTGEVFVQLAIPLLVSLAAAKKGMDAEMKAEEIPHKTALKEIKQKYGPTIEELEYADKQLRGRVEAEYKSLESVKVHGVGQVTFSQKWKYRVVDEKKLPKEYLTTVPNDTRIKADVENGVRNIKGVEVYPDRVMRVLSE